MEMKRSSKVPKLFFYLFDAKTTKKKIEPVQNILYWFKNFVLVQKFCTGSNNFVLVQKKLYQRQKLNYNIHIMTAVHFTP